MRGNSANLSDFGLMRHLQKHTLKADAIIRRSFWLIRAGRRSPVRGSSNEEGGEKQGITRFCAGVSATGSTFQVILYLFIDTQGKCYKLPFTQSSKNVWRLTGSNSTKR